MKSLNQTKQHVLLVDQFRTKVQQLHRRLSELDIHGVRAPEDESAFWEALTVDVANLADILRRIAKMKGGSARERMLRYLQLHVGEVVDGATLAAVAGVLDWARRLRELHDELGYAISSRQNDPSLKHGQYRLKSLGARQTKR